MSGKKSRKIRKSGFSKKAVTAAAFAILCSTPLASEGGDFLVSLYPDFSFPVVKFDQSLTTGFGGGLRLTYQPIENIKLFLEGDYKQYTFNTKQNIGNLSIIEGGVGAGWYLPLTDRLGLNLDAGIGYYNASYAKPDDSSAKKIPLNGLNVKGSLGLSYKIGPVVSVFASGSADHYILKNSKFLTSADVETGITVNITKAFNNKSKVQLGEHNLKPVFPVFYSWYNDNSFGDIKIYNGEDSAITDVNVYFYQSQYMNQPQNCGGTERLKKGESLSVNLKAFFNEQMLSLNEKTDTMTSIIVEYKYLGAKRSQTFPMIVPVYGRNNMSWEDDRCASAFVSSKDPAALYFAKYVVSTIRDDVRSGVPQNIQYAMAIFEALDQFGINYVKDPSSAFEDNVGTASIDFLQFPYQTLMYRGGDCDDLSILVCSLFEAVGIKTAFITIPGHIYMAFDCGLTIEQAQDYFLSLDDLIVDQDKVWLPLEITLSDEGFNRAWTKGAWEWNTAKRNGTAMLYRMEDSWQIYKPVTVPGAVARFNLPEEALVAAQFSDTVDSFVLAQITPQIAHYENLIAKQPLAQNYNDFGILYAKYGLFDQAEKQFRLARNKYYLPAVLNSANLAYSKEAYDEAENYYRQVLRTDKNNLLAMLGLARCAYEKNDYKSCDYYYAAVYAQDKALAKQYSYLGAFEQTSGRSFSLAERLENTIWLNSADYSSGNIVVSNKKDGDPENKASALIKEGQPAKENLNTSLSGGLAALAPVVEKGEREEEEEDSSEGNGASGDGDDGQNPYVGISSQLDFNILTAQDLAMLASQEIEKNGQTLDDIDLESFSLSIESNIVINEVIDEEPAETEAQETEAGAGLAASSTLTSIMTDVPIRKAETESLGISKEAPAKEIPVKEIPVKEVEPLPLAKTVESQPATEDLLLKVEEAESIMPQIEEVKEEIPVLFEEEASVKVQTSVEPAAKAEAETKAETKSETRAETKAETKAETPSPATAPVLVEEEVEAPAPAIVEEEEAPAPAIVEKEESPAPVIAEKEEEAAAPVTEDKKDSQAPAPLAIEKAPAKKKWPLIISAALAGLAAITALLFGKKRKRK